MMNMGLEGPLKKKGLFLSQMVDEISLRYFLVLSDSRTLWERVYMWVFQEEHTDVGIEQHCGGYSEADLF